MADTLAIALYRIAELERAVTEQAMEIHKIEERNLQRDRDRESKERNLLLTGIMALGAVVTTLAGIIWAYRGVIFRGSQ